MLLNRPSRLLAILIASTTLTSCDNLTLPTVVVWLKKVDFEVSPTANNSQPFVCHIAVAYSKDLFDKLQGMDSQGYFSNVTMLEKTYKDSIEIFKYDMIPGRNKVGQEIKLRSYIKARGAFLFAKYTTQGRFSENVGNTQNLLVRFLPYKMEVKTDMNIEKLSETMDSK